MTDSTASHHSGDVRTATMKVAAAPAAEAPPSFDAVYQQHFDFVWRLARRLGVAPASVDDVVQDVFVVVHRRLATFEGRSTMRSWLYGIVRRVVSDHRKKHQRRRETAMAEAPTLEAVGDPERSAQVEEELALLHELLDQLPDEQREVFVLAELEQLSAPEIVELTGVKLNTVYSRLRLARRAFERGLARARTPRATNRGES